MGQQNPKTSVKLSAEQIVFYGFQEIIDAIDQIFMDHKIGYDLGELFHFGCIYLGVYILHFDPKEHMELNQHIQHILHTEAKEGKLFFDQVQKVQEQCVTDEKSTQVVRNLIAECLKKDPVTSNTLTLYRDLSDVILQKGLKKKKKYTKKTQALIETFMEPLLRQFDLIIQRVPLFLNSMTQHPNPEILFLESCACYIGRLSGIAAGYFQTSIDEFTRVGLKNLTLVTHFSEMQSKVLH